MCLKGQGPWAEREVQEFTRADAAVDWIKSHRDEIVVGTIVIIAGVAFVAAVAGSGGAALCFVPILAVASLGPSSGLPADPQTAEVLHANP